MSEPKLPVNEIFYSLQGEGFHTGLPCVFVRLSGCNLRCPFCDTDHSAYNMMSVAQIVDEVRKYPTDTVVITGGEPSVHDISSLVDALHDISRRVHIETNGTHPLPDSIDWVTCSPKAGGTLAIEYCNELKVVFLGQNVEAIRDSVKSDHWFLQPCSCTNTAEVIDYILAHPHWRLSLQTHKLLDIR